MLTRATFIAASLLVTGCSHMKTNRTPNQEMNVVLKDSKGRTKTVADKPTETQGKEFVAIKPDEHTEANSLPQEAQQVHAAVAQAVQKIEEKSEPSAVAPTTATATTTVAEAAQPATMATQEVSAPPEIHSEPIHGEPVPTESAAKTEVAVQHTEEHTAPHKPHREPGSVTADKSLSWLQNGNIRFTKNRFRKDGASQADRTRLLAGQKPHAVVLSCSDSRVPPEVVFDQKLGEIFVIRTAGESLADNVIGSIEYAVMHLGANLVVVMGHESCGAVKATLSALKGATMDSPAMNGLVNEIKPRLQEYASHEPSKDVVDESWANANGVAHDLTERSEILRDAVATGEVKIVRAMYHMATGAVEWQQ